MNCLNMVNEIGQRKVNTRYLACTQWLSKVYDDKTTERDHDFEKK